MSREELVERYLDGQLSRRVFIRRLVLTGVTTAAALSYASVLEALPADAGVVDFYLYVQDFAFTSPAVLAFGQGVDSHRRTTPSRTRRRTRRGWRCSTRVRCGRNGSVHLTIPSAGAYAYDCSEPKSVHAKMKGKLKAPLLIMPSSGNVNTTFTVRWASGGLPAGSVADVQRKAPGGVWTTWQNGATASFATTKLATVGQWSVRARLRRMSNNKSSGWSVATKVHIS